jgi:hypothetical protein
MCIFEQLFTLTKESVIYHFVALSFLFPTVYELGKRDFKSFKNYLEKGIHLFFYLYKYKSKKLLIDYLSNILNVHT